MVLAVALRLALWPVDAGLQYVTFFPAVALTAVLAGFWPGMLTTLMGVLIATYIFTAPYWSLSREALLNGFWSNIVFTIDGLVVCLSIEAMHRFRRKYMRELNQFQQAHADSEQNRQKLKGIIDNVLDGIITIDESGVIESFNNAAQKIFGYDENEVLGKSISILMPEPDQGRHHEYMDNYLTTGEKKIIGTGREVTARRKDGSTFPMELSVCEIAGAIRRFSGVVRDISERKAHDEYMRHLAHHDPLTGLPNR